MGIVASDKGNANYKPAPEGTHTAVCCQVIDIGTQYSEFYDKESHKCLLGWELPDVLNDDGEPTLVWKRYTVSLNEKAGLRKDLQSWRGKGFTLQELEGFSLRNVLGKPCLLNITHRTQGGNTYADVSAVMALPKGTNAPDAKHPQIVFDIDAWDDKVFGTFSENLQKTILNSKEGKALYPNGRKTTAGPQKEADQYEDDDDSDVPF